MSAALRIAPLIFVAAVFQVGAVAGSRVLGAEPDLLLVTVIVVALAGAALASWLVERSEQRAGRPPA